jgi:hypothetical protein
MREASRKSSEWSARAEGMAPNWGVKKNHAKVWFMRRKWEPLQTEDGNGATRVTSSSRRVASSSMCSWLVAERQVCEDRTIREYISVTFRSEE